MPGPFDMQQQFPIAAVIDAIQKKAVYESQMQQQQRQDLLEGLKTAGEGMQSVGDTRRRLAAAMTMSKDPAVQASLGAGQAIPGTGTIGATANQQIASGPGGMPITPGMTAQGGPGMAPVPNTPEQIQQPLTPQQIAPLLKNNQDYMGEIQKASGLQRLQQAFQAKGNVVTPIIGQDGTISYGTTQVQPGSTVQHPVKITPPVQPRGRSSGGQSGMTPNQRRIAQLTTQRRNVQTQIGMAIPGSTEYNALAEQLKGYDQQINQGLNVPQGTPGTHMTTSSSMNMNGGAAGPQGLSPAGKALLDAHGVAYSPVNIQWANQKAAMMTSADPNDQQ